MHVAIPARLDDNVQKSLNSTNISNDSMPYNVYSKLPEFSSALTVISANIKYLTAYKVSIESEMGKTEQCQ